MSENELSYSSDFAGAEDAYLGEGGINFSAEGSDHESSEDLKNMFADLAAAQGVDLVAEPEGGGGKKKTKKVAPKRTKKAAASKASKGKAKKSAGKKKGGSDESKDDKPKTAAKPKAEKPKAAKPKAEKPKTAAKAPKAEKPKNDSEFVHYTMVTETGKEIGDYRVRRGKQGPSAAAAKAATRYINDNKLKDKSSGNFTVKIRQTTRGQGYDKVFAYKVEFKKEKASPAFKKMTGLDHVLKKKIIAA